MESGLSGDQRVAIVECIENYIGDWACPDPYDAADFIAARVLEITRAPSDAALVEALMDVTAHLAAAISLLSRSPKTGAASNKMFDQMLVDYDNSAARGRAALAAAKGQQP